MIAKLRQKLTLAALCALTLIFACTVALINIANTLSLQSQISQSLFILAGNNSKPEDLEETAQSRTRSNLPAIRASSLSRITDYCVIRLNKDGTLHEWKTESTDVYDDAVVATLLETITATGKTEGRVGSQAFRMEERKYGALIVAMDVSPEEGYAASLLRITLIAGSIAWALLSLLTVLLIRRTLRPVQEAVAKQQQFVWDASHELKTPLAVISANAQVLEQELGGNEYFGYIRTEIGHMNDLVQNLLLLARMDAGRQSASLACFDLGAALLGLALPMESLAFEKGKQLDVQVQEGIFCRGNETLLVQLASILLSNALKYADEGGVITLSLEARGRQRLIRVHNTGSFIPPEERRKIFDRFYRADTSRAESGSGIGLAIAQSIAELHHGEILVESDPQTGTAFTAILPNQGE